MWKRKKLIVQNDFWPKKENHIDLCISSLPSRTALWESNPGLDISGSANNVGSCAPNQNANHYIYRCMNIKFSCCGRGNPGK